MFFKIWLGAQRTGSSSTTWSYLTTNIDGATEQPAASFGDSDISNASGWGKAQPDNQNTAVYQVQICQGFFQSTCSTVHKICLAFKPCSKVCPWQDIIHGALVDLMTPTLFSLVVPSVRSHLERQPQLLHQLHEKVKALVILIGRKKI